MYFGKEPAYINNFPRDLLVGNGVQTQFDLTRSPAHSTSVLVFVGGVPQFTSYTISGFTITFNTAPANGVSIVVMHLGVRGVISMASPLEFATLFDSISGTSHDFPAPATATNISKVTVMFSGFSTNGTSKPIIRLSTSAGYETTGYDSNSTFLSTGVSTTQYTNGFGIQTSDIATNLVSGAVHLSKMDGTSNIWVANGSLSVGVSPYCTAIVGGTKTLAGALTGVRVTTVNGTDAFDAGKINVVFG